MTNTIEFQIRETIIPGLLVIQMDQHIDNRGYFTEKFQQAKLEALGFPSGFQVVQQNVSYNKATGTTRGFHAEPWDKYVSVITGEVFAAYVDLRSGSNFGKVVTITIDQGNAVFVPHGVANSFQTLLPDTYYSYLINAHWSPDNSHEYKFVNLADPELAIAWPISLGQAIMSEKDKQHPWLRDIKPLGI